MFQVLAVLALAGPAAAGGPTVPDTAAASHMGQTVTLDCNVVNVKHAHNGMTYVDCGGLFPNMLASLVVFAKDTAAVGDLDAYKGKHLLVRGKLEPYKDKPEIVLTERAQIQR
ncbi:MAG TPA: hypothetical protein VGH80_04700 [Xanthomonadaceae bacterium]|jgi:hypothetical protein